MNLVDFVKRFNENAFTIDELVNNKGIPKDIAIIISKNELLKIRNSNSDCLIENINSLIEMTDISEKTVGKIDFIPPYRLSTGNIVFAVIEDIYYLLYNKTQILIFEDGKEDELFICLNNASFVSFLLQYYISFMSKERGFPKSILEIKKLCSIIDIDYDCFFINLIMKN